MAFNHWHLDDGKIIALITPSELKNLSDGTQLYDIFGRLSVKGKDPIDLDTRAGLLAYGILEPVANAEQQLP